MNHHTWKPVYVGEIKKDGQFKIVFKTPDLVAPDSYSRYLHPVSQGDSGPDRRAQEGNGQDLIGAVSLKTTRAVGWPRRPTAFSEFTIAS